MVRKCTSPKIGKVNFSISAVHIVENVSVAMPWKKGVCKKIENAESRKVEHIIRFWVTKEC